MSHLGVYLPGGYEPGQDPFTERLAWVTIQALVQSGAEVETVLYERVRARNAQEFGEFREGVVRDVRASLDRHKPERLTLVGKSLGCHALGCLLGGGVWGGDAPAGDLMQLEPPRIDMPEDTRLIWVTPNWGADSTWAAACSNTIASLNIVGLADYEYHRSDRHEDVPGRTLSIPEADHRLEIAGDVGATLAAWRSMAEAIIDFASRRDALAG